MESLSESRKIARSLRNRKYLTDLEVERLRKGARASGRHKHRNDLIIFMMFRHALRVTELIRLKWDQVDLDKGLLHVRRIKNGIPSTHPLRGEEMRLLRMVQRQYDQSVYVFTTERKSCLSYDSVYRLVANAGKNAKFDFPINPHMLRHSTGFYLANKGEDTRAIQAYMGHANIDNTVLYTELSPGRFKNFWED